METLNAILGGFAVAAQPMNLFFVFLGAVMGTVIGMLPGIGPAAGIALLLPVTFGMEPVSALIMLAGIYYGAMYGNTASAILINTPGTASAAMTTVDGYPLAKSGRGGAALAIAAIASFIAGTMGIIILSLLAVPFATFALRFGPAEYFMLMAFSLTAVSALTGKSPAKGAISAVLGLMVASIGIDLQSGQARFTMGIPEFLDGVGLLVVIVGLFAVGECLRNVEKWFEGTLQPIPIRGKLWFTRDEWNRSVGPITRGGLIGFAVGVLPGAGGTIATILAYATEQKLSKRPEKFGTGAVEGVAAPEAANNGSTCGAFVPLLTLGVPGSGVTAVLLGAFIMYGIQPGPMLFQNRPDLVWGLINSMYIGNIMLLVLNLPMIPLFAKMLYAPPGVLLAIILGIASVGIYSVGGSTTSLYVLIFFGAAGYLFRRLEIPAPPLILALVLGGIMEQSFRQAMTISGGNPKVFVGSTICIILLAMIVVAVVMPLLMSRLRALPGRVAARSGSG
ncbi:MAG: tripartite tricarboxylate transporter permease [Burkholderiales bacterium]|jgi:putative tricarboxylic transport membrane protein|nr:tripartite tricarboxylate transporter permease [Burkholderiales bacterium]